MLNTPTPHIEAKIGEVAKTVLMPGDPLRARFIAEEYLTDVRCFNKVRNMFGYTGKYQGRPVSVMGSGMGMPSIGIYSYELFHGYGVETILRIGTAGGLADGIQVGDLVLGQAACTNSNYASQFQLSGNFCPIADFTLLKDLYDTGQAKGFRVRVGNILSSDTFYNARADENRLWADMGVLAVEMEAAALYMNAIRAGKRAACICTISDLPFTGESMTSKEREQSLHRMIETALESTL